MIDDFPFRQCYELTDKVAQYFHRNVPKQTFLVVNFVFK